MAKFIINFLLSIFVLAIPIAAAPRGAEAVTDLYAPAFSGGGAFVTSTGSAEASAVNPAAAGAAQRIVLDASYLFLPGLGDEAGTGHALNVGGLLPTKYGVFGGAARFLTSPFDAFDVGTAFSIDLNAAKEIFPRFSVGAGLNAGVGSAAAVGVDLGLRHELGALGPLDNFTWAFVLGGIGVSRAPSAFTPAAGVDFDFYRIRGKEGKPDPLRLGASAARGMPGFRNLAGKLRLDATGAGIATVSTATGFNLNEARDGEAPSLVPSVGLTLNLKLAGKKDAAPGKLPQEGELDATFAAKPLYDDIWAFGAGAVWTLGLKDETPPAIRVDYTGPTWISPNNDGKVDALEFPIAITDQRYVAEWLLEIRDEAGVVVRTLRNKERRIENEGVRGFIDRLAYVKAGVEVPATLRWDGALDSGAVAADGRYFFVLSAADDNGNRASSPSYEVVVDNTPPAIAVKPPADPTRILSPDGDGNKDTILIDQSGSVEDRWTASVLDASGAKVRTYDVAALAPAPFAWDGKDDAGKVVADGVYRYEIAATDRALNSAKASLDNLIVNTERPTVSLLIEDAFFSPNGDGVKDTLGLSPGVPVRDGIVSWTIAVQDKAGAVRRTIAGGPAAPARLAFDGKTDAGATLAEGSYRAQLTVTYRNGFVSTNLSPAFTVDLTPPAAAVRPEYPVFSPNGDGKLDEMALTQEASDEVAWKGELSSVDAALVVKTFRFAGVPAASIRWDGRDDSGRLAPDGDYSYRLVATDRAGNSGASQPARFALSTADTPLLLTADLLTFSPNGDGAKDVLTLAPQVKVTEGIASWSVEIVDAAGTTVRGFQGTGTVPKTIAWNGTDAKGARVSDGVYAARAVVRYAMGNEPTAASPRFIVDTVAPAVELSAPYTLFSPNADGRKDDLPFAVRTAGNDEWEAAILDKANAVVATWVWTGAAPAVVWKGLDAAGNLAADGAYRFRVRSTDEAGNRTERVLDGIVLDARTGRAFLTASAQALSPNGDGVADEVRFGTVVTLKDGIETWKLEILDEAGTARRTFAPADAAAAEKAPPAEFAWNGKDEAGSVVEGKRSARLTVSYRKGDLVTAVAGPFLVDVTAPVLKLESSPRWFSPDNDGVEDELSIALSALDASAIDAWSLEIVEPQPPYQVFSRFEGKGSPSSRIVWDGRSTKGELVQAATDYKAIFRAKDVLGNAAEIPAVIGVDVLVIREGDILKIKVPSIIFRENQADFVGLPQDIVDNNVRVLKRIAEILNKFKDYQVKVEGHANPVARTAAEEKNELQPLSEARAKAVLAELVRNGVNADRLSAIGMGGTRPVVKWEARDDWWKNRRVEFILIK